MTDRTTSAVLLEAAAILERDGWCQDWFGTQKGPNCALGAIARAAGVRPYEWASNPLALTALARVTKAFGLDARKWNDKPGRTASEVIAKLREAAGASP